MDAFNNRFQLLPQKKNPAIKGMDEASSNSRIVYEAMPAVSADGQNIMTLVPVRKAEEKMKPDLLPTQIAVTVKITKTPAQAVRREAPSSAVTQFVRKQVSLGIVKNLDLSNSQGKNPPQKQPVNLLGKVQMISTNKEKSVPSQHLQVPAYKQVFPPSKLLKPMRETLPSPANSSTDSDIKTLVYMSLVKPLNQTVSPTKDCVPPWPKQPSTTAAETPDAAPFLGPRPHLKLVPRATPRPNSPIRWVIEEEDPSPAAAPLSRFVESEILRTVAEREKACRHPEPQKLPLSPEKNRHVDEDALVMYDGKDFRVFKKQSPALESTTTAGKTYLFNKNAVPTRLKSQPADGQPTQQDLRLIMPRRSHKVINFCDAQDSKSQRTAHLDEDNVIFMSYIPPKSDLGSTEDEPPERQTQMEVKETTAQRPDSQVQRTAHLEEDNVIFMSYIPPKSDPGSAEDRTPERQTTQMEIKETRAQSPDSQVHSGEDGVKLVEFVSVSPGFCGSAMTNVLDQEKSNIRSDQSTSTPRIEMKKVNVKAEDGEESNSTLSVTEKAICDLEKSLNPKSCQMSDHLLRQMFGITAELKVCLQKADAAFSGSSVESEEHQLKPKSESKQEELLLNCDCSKETDRSVSSACDRSKDELSSFSSSPSPHTLTRPPMSPQQKTKILTALRNKLLSQECSTKPDDLSGYMEPIDEEFLRTDDKHVPHTQDQSKGTHTHTSLDICADKRRAGRKRKRTICPCCIPGTQNLAVKMCKKAEFPERSEPVTGLTKKKGGKKTARKRVSCSKGSFDAPGGGLCPTSVSADELKCYEEIQRLRELLREKEAALELLRKGSSSSNI